MKKLSFLIVLLLAGVLVLNAQTEAGKVLIGTSTNLYGTAILSDCPNGAAFAITSSKYKTDEYESDTYKTTSFNVSPRLGFFAIDGLLLGLEASFAFFDEEDWDESMTYFDGGPFARYYLNLANFKPFVQAGLNAGQLKDTGGDKMRVLNYGGGIGGAFFIGDNISIDLLANYSHTILKDKDDPDNGRSLSDVFGFGIGLSIFL